MKNTMLTYTMKVAGGEVKNTIWTDWATAQKTAEALLLDVYMAELVDNMVATWYDVDGTPLLRRKYNVGIEFWTEKRVLYVEDIDY